MRENNLSLDELERFDSKSPKTRNERRFLCPMCGVNKSHDAAHRSLVVNQQTGTFFCHRCQAKGKLREFWEERPKMSKQSRTRLKLISHFSTDETSVCRTLKDEKKKENPVEKMAQYQTELVHSPAEIYLSNRGILPAVAQTAGCGYADNWEHWEKKEEKWILQGTDRRVVFPVTSREGTLVAIHTRAIDESCFNSSKITRGDKSDGVFRTRQDLFKAKPLAICEAPIDALALEMCGIPALALIGTNGPDWLALECSFTQVLIATDADDAGDKAAFQLKQNLVSRGAKTFRLRPRGAKDWSEVLENMGAEKLSEFLRPFSENISDESRLIEAVKLFETGREEAAEFVAELIRDINLKSNFLYELFKRKQRAA